MRLFALKLAHSLVFLVETTAIFYILYSGIVDRRDGWLALAVFLVLAEIVVFIGNRLRCPMTRLAQHLGDPRGDDFIADIFLPAWFVPLVPHVCGTLAIVGLLIVAFRVLAAL
ncbi:MAG: hypothetical protein ACOCXR_00705 [Phototrophicaceae bacterium]